MGQYAVLHISKGKGASSGLTNHNERVKNPKNANKELSHLNVIEDYKHLGKNLKERALNIIQQAGVKRKIQKDAVLYCPIILSGSHETMIKLRNEGKLKGWIDDNKKFLEKTFGKENIISFAMHADEKTPHIHASIVPIILNKKGPKLSARDLISPKNLKKFQSDYAKNMAKYGLERGMDSKITRAKHQEVNQFYRDLPEKLKELKEEKQQLQREVGNFRLKSSVKKWIDKKNDFKALRQQNLVLTSKLSTQEEKMQENEKKAEKMEEYERAGHHWYNKYQELKEKTKNHENELKQAKLITIEKIKRDLERYGYTFKIEDGKFRLYEMPKRSNKQDKGFKMGM